MLSNYFGEKQILKDTFVEILRIQIQKYHHTFLELKYGAFYLTTQVSAHGLGLLVQLSWRVAPPYKAACRTAPASPGLLNISMVFNEPGGRHIFSLEFTQSWNERNFNLSDISFWMTIEFE